MRVIKVVYVTCTCAFSLIAVDSYVMKLFDRSVDLAQFTEDTPLYPICRSWIQNKRHSQAPSSSADTAHNTAENEVHILCSSILH